VSLFRLSGGSTSVFGVRAAVFLDGVEATDNSDRFSKLTRVRKRGSDPKDGL